MQTAFNAKAAKAQRRKGAMTRMARMTNDKFSMKNSQFRFPPFVGPLPRCLFASSRLRAFALKSCVAALALNLCAAPKSQAGTFLPCNPMLTARVNHTATLLPNGKVLIAGGIRSGQAPATLSNTEIYDPEYDKESPLR